MYVSFESLPCLNIHYIHRDLPLCVREGGPSVLNSSFAPSIPGPSLLRFPSLQLLGRLSACLLPFPGGFAPLEAAPRPHVILIINLIPHSLAFSIVSSPPLASRRRCSRSPIHSPLNAPLTPGRQLPPPVLAPSLTSLWTVRLATVGCVGLPSNRNHHRFTFSCLPTLSFLLYPAPVHSLTISDYPSNEPTR